MPEVLTGGVKVKRWQKTDDKGTGGSETRGITNLEATNRRQKPHWLKTKLHTGGDFAKVAEIVGDHDLNTICQSGRCPNKAECWSRHTATFMVAGDVCTRACSFCATSTGRPLPLDESEPQRVSHSVSLMGLHHAVLTSVTRDDLSDGGAAHWARVIETVRAENPKTTIEILIPDFGGREALLDIVLAARPDIAGHNLETVERLTPLIRSRAEYKRSIEVLKYLGNHPASSRHPSTGGEPLVRPVSKSGLMVGLGESRDEVLRAMDDLREAGVRILTIGQYLRPTLRHTPVVEYVTPSTFEFYRAEALRRGFDYAACAPLVRSSYMAHEALKSVAV